MISEPDKMNSEMNGTSIKSEGAEVKEEPKEESKTGTPTVPELGIPNSGSPSNKLTNGETENNNQSSEDVHIKKDVPAVVKKEETNGEQHPTESKPSQQNSQLPPQPTPPVSQPVSSNVTPMTGPLQQQPQQGPVSVEAPFMQHQSQIFVFSTQLANDAADSIMGGRYKDLISYHMEYPATKKFLQKHSLKLPPINRSALPHQGMNPQIRHRSVNMMKGQRGMMGPFPPHSSASVAQWVDQQNVHLQEQGYNFPPGMSARGGNFPGGPNQQMMGPWPQGGPGPGPGSSTSPMNFQMMGDSMGFDPEMMAMMGGGMHGQPNPSLLHAKVPNENLTPEQLKRREEQLTSLHKLQQLLFPEQRQGYGPGPQGPSPGPGGMMPDGMHAQMMQQQQGMMGTGPHGPHGAMMSQEQAMMNSQNSSGMMTSQNSGGMMSSQQQYMMSHGMPPYGQGPGSGPGGGPPGMGPHGPHNMQNMSQAQREWLRLQQEFYVDKRRMQQQQMAQRMGQQQNMDMPVTGGGAPPPPSYQSTIAQKRVGSAGGMSMSTSPNSNGPLGSPPMMPSHGMEPQDPMAGMFPHQGQRRPSMSSMDQPNMGMMSPGMPPGGGGGGFVDKAMLQGGPGGPGPHPSHPHMHPNQGAPMPNMKNSQVSVQRAGNPEQFQMDMVVSRSPSGTSASKPPPSYQQSQTLKRKRPDDMEEIYKNLQPTPSPQQINYLNQFEGQELTITKQLNAAYREPNTPSDQSHGSQFPVGNQVAHSPMHGPSSNKGPMSNSSQTSSGGPLSSPGPMSVPGPSPMSGANMRLSHYDPPSNNNSVSSAPATPTTKTSSMSNITSASLANLAKGVEHLSNQMQQNMMQGGPFHSIQMQGQQQQQMGSSAGPTQTTNQSPVCTSAEVSSQTHTTPSVNNTFVNATMSIQQLNIQSVNPNSGHNYNPQMQVQQMNMDHQQAQQQQQQQQMQSQGGPNIPQGPNIPPSAPTTSNTVSMSQSQSMMAGNMPVKNAPYSGQHRPPSSQMSAHQGPPGPNIPSSASGPPGPSSGTMMGPNGQVGGPMMQQHPQRTNSPSFNSPPGSMGNANVQIQAKAPNTIQYLPAHPPATQHSMQPQKRPDLDFMQRFSAPMGNLENKIPTSKMQYFPQGPQGMPGERNSPFGNHPGHMGPGMSPSMMVTRGGSAGDFPPGMSGGPMGPMSGMGSPDPMSMNSMGNNVMPGNMPPEAAMMGGGMPMGPGGGMMGMDGMPPGGVMGPGGMPHPNSPPFQDSREQMIANSMMQGGPHMSPRGHGGHMMGHGPGRPDMMPSGPASRMAAEMANFGPSMSRQQNAGSMRMPGGNPNISGMPGPGGGNPAYNAQYQQFQQQLYAQGGPRQMSPMSAMMQGPGQPYMNMMPGP